ncbi:MAG: hypothetical protein NZ898_04855 [Myxococcota bacterium]|nr:hypothetical protein [Myxococcota bacterium]MDW8362859.1 hypothetical protein [Myxococcales bacterium]
MTIRRHGPSLACLATLIGLAGCKVTRDDIEYWKGTVKGPGKIVAVLRSERYPMELRIEAALALVEMERTDIDGVARLGDELGRLDVATRTAVVEGLVPRLEAILRGEDGSQGAGPATGVPPGTQIRAKDAAFLITSHAGPAARQRLVEAMLRWFIVDFEGRNLTGQHSGQQVVESLGAPAAAMLVDALGPDGSNESLVRLAQLIKQYGDPETRARAAQRLVQVEAEIQSPAYLDRLAARIREQLEARRQTVDPAQVAASARATREERINAGVLPAMQHLASEPSVAERLLAIASVSDTSPAGVERRVRALRALGQSATRAHLDRLLALALDPAAPVPVRDEAFDRIGDIGSPDAIPRLWPLLENAATQGTDAEKERAQRLRWRAGELILHLGGGRVVAEFFNRLPTAEGVAYEPEELEGYAQRLSLMTPPPTDFVRAQLQSPDWWDRVIALRFLERRGTQADAAAMARLERDGTQVAGKHWRNFEQSTVGHVATAALRAMRERLAEPTAPTEEPRPGADGGGARPATAMQQTP